MSKSLAILALCLGLCACASPGPGTSGRPDWVDGKSADYPATRYLTDRKSVV